MTKKLKLIGVTETYDPAFIPDWETRLKDANIIITKNLTNDIIDKLILNKDKCILHHTITGHGGSIYEPNVPSPEWNFKQFESLIEKGFPITQYVLRIDPIFTNNDFGELKTVLGMYESWMLANTPENWAWVKPSIKKLRCRVSVLDMYKHVVERFKENGLTPPYETFHAPLETFKIISGILGEVSHFEFESCAEKYFDTNIVNKTSCVSLKDIKCLGLDENDFSLELKGNRIGCGCLNKVNILGVKPERCPHQCMYCYWKS